MSENYHSGFVAIMGRPNVGKSTLVNAFLQQKIAPVSPRPQTTRRKQLGILTLENAQVIFVDTPGVHQPRHKLGEKMNAEAMKTLEESDLILFIADVTVFPGDDDNNLAGWVAKLKQRPPIILALNKMDRASNQQLEDIPSAYHQLVPQAQLHLISASKRQNLEELLTSIINLLPFGMPLFSEAQLTDLYERDLAGELVRESCLIYLQDEIPHGITVRIDQFTERNEHGAYIEATIFVERESHKGIVIGQNGLMLKKIGAHARKEIEEMSGRKVFLSLRVKVSKNWRNSEKMLRRFNY